MYFGLNSLVFEFSLYHSEKSLDFDYANLASLSYESFVVVHFSFTISSILDASEKYVAKQTNLNWLWMDPLAYLSKVFLVNNQSLLSVLGEGCWEWWYICEGDNHLSSEGLIKSGALGKRPEKATMKKEIRIHISEIYKGTLFICSVNVLEQFPLGVLNFKFYKFWNRINVLHFNIWKIKL